MATKKKHPQKRNKTSFKPGNSASKGYGRPKLTDEQKALALTTRTQFKTLLSQYSALTLSDIKKHLREKKLPAIDMAVLKHIEKMIDDGSMDRVDWTANHIMGKPKEVNHVHLKAESVSNMDLKKLSDAELQTLKALQLKAKADD